MGEREDLAAEVRRRVGDRPIAWFGPRGEDVLPLERALGRSIDRYSITADAQGPAEHCLERQWGERVDLDTYSIDRDPRPEVAAMRRRLVEHCDRDGVLVSYRASQIVDDALGATSGTGAFVAALPNRFVTGLEHKPTLERVAEQLGIPVIEWHYLSADTTTAPRFAGPAVVRPDVGSGGSGIHIVEELDPTTLVLPADGSGIAVSRFLDQAVPLNVSGVVWPDGAVSVHPASVQLVGVRECTSYDLGYCGNDFSAAAALDPTNLDQVERIVERFGAWLHSSGYRGAFGLDLLVDGDTVRFVECNARFQGSTRLASDLSAGIDEPCAMLDHLAACLGVPGPGRRPALVEMAPALGGAHVVVHNTRAAPVQWRDDLAQGLVNRGLATEVQLGSSVAVAPGGALARVVTEGSVLNLDARTVMPGLRAMLSQAVAQCELGVDAPAHGTAR